MKTKTTVRYHLTPVRMAIIKKKNLQIINAREKVEKREPSHYWWKCKLVQPLWRRVWRFLRKLGIKVPYAECL